MMFANPSKRRQAVGLLAFAFLCCGVAMLAGSAHAQSKDGKDDIQLFKGAWDVAKITKDGIVVEDDILKSIKITFNGDKISIDFLGADKKGTIKIDSTKKPKHIDLKFEDGDNDGFGIFEFNGDEVKIHAAQKKEDRPKDFKSEPPLLILLKRSASADKVTTDKKGGREQLVTAPARHSWQAKTEKHQIHSTWSIVSGVKGGMDLPPELVGKIKLTFNGEKLSVVVEDQPAKTGTFKLDDKTTPRQIDLKIEDNNVVGIYEISGDTLKICHAEPGGARPTEFKADAASPNALMVLKREKAEVKKSREQLVTAPSPRAVQEKAGKHPLTGTWTVTGGTKGGMEMPPEAAGKMKMTFDADKVTMEIEQFGSKNGTFKTDDKAKPRQIDLTFDDKLGTGIYEINGDVLKICLVDPKDGSMRPKEFKSDAGSPNTIMLFKRDKAAKTDKKRSNQPFSSLAIFHDRQDKKEATQPGKSDKENIQGTWKVESAIFDGMDVDKGLMEMVKFFVKGDKIEINIGDLPMKGTYTVDESKKPKLLDIKFEGSDDMVGIYEMSGDKVKFCMVEKGQPRPKEFASPGGSGYKLVVLVRDKEAKKDDTKKEPRAPLRSFQVSLPNDEVQGAKDEDLIQGTWQAISFTEGGMKKDKNETDSMKVTIKGNKFILSHGDMSKSANMKLDAAKKPKQIDLVLEEAGDDQIKGIYELNGDTLRICATHEGQDPRPTEFKSDAGGKTVLVEFKRVAAKKQPRASQVSQPLYEVQGAKDQDLIQGTWQATSFIERGNKMDGKEVGQIELTIKSDQVTFVHKGKGDKKSGTVTLDPTKKPKQIDLVSTDDKPGKLQGIYELTGDTLRICAIDDDQKTRPTEFKSEPGSGDVLVEFKRVAVKQPSGKPAPPADTDLGRITGVWKLLKARADGEDAPADFVATVRMTFDTDGALVVEGTPNNESGKFKIDPNGQPKQIDLFAVEMKENSPGIYKFEDGKLLLCFPAISTKERPKDFNAEKGSRQLVFVMEQTQTGEQMVKARVDEVEMADRRRSAGNLSQIGLAIHRHHDSLKGFPAHAIYSKDEKTPLLSWRVAILPYVGQESLYKQFRLDESWDSEHNKNLIAKMPKVYEPVGLGSKGEGMTYYQVFTGKDTAFDGPKKAKLPASFPDGTSNTVLVVEAKNPVIWTKPDDLALPKSGDKMPELGGLFSTGMNVLFCDASVQWVRIDLDPVTLRAIVTPNGGEAIDRSKLELPSSTMKKDAK